MICVFGVMRIQKWRLSFAVTLWNLKQNWVHLKVLNCLFRGRLWILVSISHLTHFWPTFTWNDKTHEVSKHEFGRGVVCPKARAALDMVLVLRMCLFHLAPASHVWVVMSWNERFSGLTVSCCTTVYVLGQSPTFVRLWSLFPCVGWMGRITHSLLMLKIPPCWKTRTTAVSRRFTMTLVLKVRQLTDAKFMIHVGRASATVGGYELLLRVQIWIHGADQLQYIAAYKGLGKLNKRFNFQIWTLNRLLHFTQMQ